MNSSSKPGSASRFLRGARLGGAFVFFATALLASATASPQDAAPPAETSPSPATPTPAPEPLSPEQAEQAGLAELGRALDAIAREDMVEGARLAYIAYEAARPNAERRESAEIALAETLERLGYTQAALEHHLSVIEGRHDSSLVPRALAAIERAARDGRISEEDLTSGPLAGIELAGQPSDLLDFLHYERGLSDMRLGEREWAERNFRAIPADTHYGQAARRVRLVALVRENKADQALAQLDDLFGNTAEDRASDPSRAPASDPAPDSAVARRSPARAATLGGQAPSGDDRLRLIHARLLFEKQRIPEALEIYKALRQTPETPAGEVLLERAWAHYRAGEYHDAMGLLYALGAPVHRRLFLPDQYILRGLIYQRFCHFRAARGAVRDFRERYGRGVFALTQGAAPHDVAVIRAAAADLGGVAPELKILRAVERERALLADAGGAIEDGGLRAHLEQVYTVLDARARRRTDAALEAGARAAAERLLDAHEQADLLEYEVGVSIHKPLVRSQTKLRAPAEEVPAGGEKVYFPFDGEYWTDELADMRFLIQDRCVE